MLEITDIILAVVSAILAGSAALGIKSIIYKNKRPNGKKGGITSLHVALAFSIVTAIALITQDWFLTGTVALLAYLIAKGRMDERQHHLYQVAISAVLGIALTWGTFYIYNNKFGGGSNYSIIRDDFDDKPESAPDDRYEADSAPDLRLEEF